MTDVVLGTAWLPNTHSTRERCAMLDEALAVIRALWSEREATFEGRYYRLDRCPP